MLLERISQAFLFDQIHAAPKEVAQFLRHLCQVRETPGGVGCKAQQDVNVTARPKARAQDRAEQPSSLTFQRQQKSTMLFCGTGIPARTTVHPPFMIDFIKR